MKKLFTLLFLTLAAFTFKTVAQTTTCNAGFTFGISGLSVNFTAAITGDPTINHHYWKFGDGSISSDISPVHVYASGGAYTVTHILYRSNNSGTAECVDSIQKRVELSTTTISCNLHAGFTFERDPLQSNKIKFTNLSTPANDIKYVKWSFGDGTSSSDFNTSHTYTTSGLYTVCLAIVNNTATGCYRDTCLQVQVQVPPPPTCDFTAYFAWHADSLQANKIFFQHLSTHFEPGDSIRWTFGDGTSSTDVNPTHTYTTAGIYNVCIRVQKKTAAGTTPCVREYCKQVIVGGNICRLEAGFTFAADATNKNKIWFKNTSSPISSVINVQWSFGDGTSSNAMNPDHTYAHAGIYNVCLKISTSTSCYREVCKTVEIRENEINCVDISKFSITRSTVNCLEFKFIPAAQNPNWKYIWSFGDGTGSTEMSPTHIYPRAGNYTVFLTVYRSSACVSTSYKVAETGACFSCNNAWAKFEYKRETPNKLYFHALSNLPILSQTWTITKLTISGSSTVTLNQTNPSYTFNEPGDYRVCLRVVTYGQCVREYCEVIHISASTECSLIAYPNPATNNVNVGVSLTSPEIIHVYIFNSLNILVKQKDQQGNTGTNIVTTNIEGLVPGWYTIKVIYGNRVCYSKFQKI